MSLKQKLLVAAMCFLVLAACGRIASAFRATPAPLQVGARQSPPVDQETILTFVHDFLEVFYPELLNKKYRLTLCSTAPADASWRDVAGVFFTFTPAEISPVEKLISSTPQTTDHPILSGSFWLPPVQYERILQFHAYSDVVHEQQLNDLQQVVKSHPNWSENQLIAALKRAGVRFGPRDKEAFASSLHLREAERFLGRLQIDSIDFESRGSAVSDELTWTVRAHARLGDGKDHDYVLTFEPFDGKLIRILRH
jgi:hypothetical protein